MKTFPYGDRALYVDLELADAPDRAARTRAVASALRSRLRTAQVVVGAGAIAIAGVGAWDDLDEIIADCLRTPREPDTATRVHAIRARYDGPDLAEVADRAGLSEQEIVEIHGGREYEVELIGFLPGFAYLTSLDPRIVMPRRAAPRARVEPRSLAIAGAYTGIYPMASPGGWHLIGHVLGVDLFDPSRDPPSLFAPGDRVRFVVAEG